MRSKRLRKLSNNEFCWYCGDPSEDVDHVIPVSKGGKTDHANLVPACRPCNNCKRNLAIEEFRDYLKQCAARRSTKHTVVKVKPYGFIFYGERMAQSETGSVSNVEMRQQLPQEENDKR